MTKILITGASGFIGSFLIEDALNHGFETWAGVRKSSSRLWLRDERIRFIDLNFSDKEVLKKQIETHVAQYGKWDYIVHNAGVTKCLNNNDFERVNYLFTQHFAEALRETNATPSKFVYMSSYSVVNSRTVYGQSKRKAEQFLESLTDFPYIILRPTGVYGPRDRDYLLVLKTLKQGIDVAAGCSVQKLTFIYVKDLSKAVFLALESRVTQKIYSVADGDVYTDKAYTHLAQQALGKKRVIHIRVPLPILKIVSILAEYVSRWTHKPSTLNRDKYEIMAQRDWSCDTQAIETDLYFHADYDLKRGLEESVQWYNENNWL